MKPAIALLCCLFILNTLTGSQLFEDNFENQTLRFEFYHVGNSQEECFILNRIVAGNGFSGNPRTILHPSLQGRYLVKVFCLPQKELIYLYSYDSFFAEYKTTEPALSGEKKVFQEVIRIPRPRTDFLMTIELRASDNTYSKIYEQEFEYRKIFIEKDYPDEQVEVINLLINGEPAGKVDLLFVAEGYTRKQKQKAVQDAKRFAAILFKYEPYKSNQEKFNIRLLFKPSLSEGITQPARGISATTPFQLSFDTFGISRYVLCPELFALHRAAAHTDYDAILIMFNSARYGGGGIFNFYATFPADNIWSEYIFIHEMGHSFAGLADEYYSSSVAYNDFYPAGIEPLEPNITAFLDVNKLKWKELLTLKKNLPVSWEKEEFEKLDASLQQERAELEKELDRLYIKHAPQEQISKLEKRLDELSQLHARKIDQFLQNSKYYGKVGVFEGAGYAAKGLFRSEVDCIMFSKGFKPFCMVCKKAIQQIIDFFSF